MNLGALVVRLLLERAQFRTELAQTVQETNAAASKVQGHAATITGAVTDAVNGQTTAVQTATRALSVLGPVAATATAAALAVGAAFHQAQQETPAYEKAIILSGNAAGVTSGQLADMARRLDGVAGTQANAAAALASMTAGGKVAQENLEKVALAAIEMERATGQAIGETEKIFSSLGKDPVKASLRLNESMNYLTASTYAQMKAADDLGDKEAAASIAQNAAADALRDRAGRVEQQLGLLERAWRGVRDVAKEAWDNMLNVGRPDTLSTQIANVRQKIAQAKGEDPNRRFSTPFDTPLAELEQQLAYLTEQERMIRRGTEAQAERNRVQSAGIAAVDALGKANERTMSRQEQAAKALDAYRENLKAVRAAYEQAPSDALAKLLDPAVIEKAEAAIRKQGETVARTTKAALSEYDKLMQRLGTDVPKAAAEAEAAQHGYNKAQTEFLALAGSPAWAKFTSEQRASAAAQFEKKIASEQAAEAIKAEEKATVEATKAREKSLATAEKELEKLRASVVAQEEQNARLGLSKEAIAELDAAKLEMLATDAEMQAANALFLNQNGELFLVLQKQAKAYRDLAQAKRDGAAKQVDVDREKQIEDAAGKAAKEGEKAAERIEQSLTDALMRGFESGKDFAKNLRDTVVNMFKTMVLRPVVSAIVNPISQGITGMMGLSGAAQAGQGMSAIGAAGNLFSAGSALGGLGAVGGALSGFTTAATASIQSLVGMSGTVAQMTTSLAAAGHTAATGVSAGVQAFQAIPGWGWAIAGVAALAAIFSKKSTPHMGAASSYSEAGGLVSGADIYRASGLADTRTYNAGVEQVTGNVAKAIGDTLNATAKAFGQTAGYEITTAFADDTSKDGAWGQLLIEQMGKTVLDWRDTQTSKWAPREFADGEAGSKEYLAEVAKGARDALVQAIGSVDWATDMLKGLGDTVSLESLAQTVQQINAAKAAFVGFGQYMPAFASLADSAVSKLVQASGGVDALAGNMSVFVAEFFTEEERLKVATDNVTAELAKLGYEMPRTRDEFKALLQANIALGDAGADTVAGLLKVSGAFASVTEKSETAADAAARLADEQGKAAEDAARAAEEAARRAEEIARERYGLETQIMQLLGDTAGLRMREIEALDASNRALQEHIYAIEDARAAYDKSIASAQSAYGVLESSVGRDRNALQSTLDAERDAISARYKLQQDGHAAQLSAAQSAADKMRGIASMLSGALGRMVVESPALDRARLQSARGVIGAAAASSNVMAPGLEAALSVVAGDVRKMYGKWEDFAFDQGVTAGQTAALSSAAQSQLTGYESIVNALKSQDDVTKLLADAEMAAAQERFDSESKKLDERLEQGKSMLDRLLGIEEGTLSSVEALARLTDAVNAGNAALQAQRAAEAAARMAASGGGITAPAGSGQFYTDSQGNRVEMQAGQSLQWWEAVAQSGTSAVSSLAELEQRLAARGKTGIFDKLVSGFQLDSNSFGGNFNYTTLLDSDGGLIANQGGFSPEMTQAEREAQIEQWAKAWKVPGFATGINRVPHDMLARIHKDEAVVPAAYNPYNPGASAPGNSEVVAELRKLNERMARIEASSNATAGHTAGTDRKLARVIRNDAMITEALPA